MEVEQQTKEEYLSEGMDDTIDNVLLAGGEEEKTDMLVMEGVHYMFTTWKVWWLDQRDLGAGMLQEFYLEKESCVYNS